MGYKILLFDLDDTLLDFSATEIDSLNKLFNNNGYIFTEELFEIYNGVNRKLWCDFEEGIIPMDDVLNSRFSKTMLKLGETVDGIAWENMYRDLLGNGLHLIDGALELCKDLSLTHRLFVITNGIRETQLRRLRGTGLIGYFEEVFDSQSIGYQKPAKQFFDFVAGNISDFNIGEALIIGDSLNTDIKGGYLSGIDTCWLNEKSHINKTEIKSKYSINSLLELYKILQS